MKQHSKYICMSLAVLAYSAVHITTAEALPRNANGTVISGTATIVDTSATETTINQSTDFAEINWTDFDIAVGQDVRFNVPRAQSVTVNRVTSGMPSNIAGDIYSNGQVYVINENGLNFNGLANFNAASFYASTIDTFNAEADAAQYAEIVINSTGMATSGAYPLTNFIFLSPHISFIADTKDAGIEAAYGTLASANRATLSFTGPNNDPVLDVPDNQPDVVVPGGKSLGISAISLDSTSIFGFGMRNEANIIAKAVSVAQNISSIINLDGGPVDIGSDQMNYFGALSDQGNDTTVNIETTGHMIIQGDVILSPVVVSFGAGNVPATQRTLNMDVDGNLFIDEFHSSADVMNIRVGQNLIINDIAANTGSTSDGLFMEGTYGVQTITLESGSLNVENTNIDFSTLSGIETYAAGQFGHVHVGHVGLNKYSAASHPDMVAGVTDAYIAVTTNLSAPEININTDLDYTGSQTASNFMLTAAYEPAPAVEWRYFVDPTPGTFETAPLSLTATGDVNIAGNINMAGMGDLNITAANYNVTGSVATGASAENVTIVSGGGGGGGGTPPAATPTVDDIVANPTKEVIKEVKDTFFEQVGDGSQNTFEQVATAEPVLAQKQESEQNVFTAKLKTPDVAEGGDTTEDSDDVSAASCIDGVCTAVDQDNKVLVVDQTYLKRKYEFVPTLADRVVNLKGVNLIGNNLNSLNF